MCATKSKLKTETLPSYYACMMAIYHPPSSLSTHGFSMGTGMSGSSTSVWTVSAWVGDAIVAWVSGVVIGVAEPAVTGVGGIPVTCLHLVLCLLPARALKHW